MFYLLIYRFLSYFDTFNITKKTSAAKSLQNGTKIK